MASLLVFWLGGMWGFNFPTRDQTHRPGSDPQTRTKPRPGTKSTYRDQTHRPGPDPQTRTKPRPGTKPADQDQTHIQGPNPQTRTRPTDQDQTRIRCTGIKALTIAPLGKSHSVLTGRFSLAHRDSLAPRIYLRT